MATTLKIHPVILSGGSGTRLWPLSRKSFPKQFSRVLGDQSLFQQTLNRLRGVHFADPITITGESSRFLIIEQLKAINSPTDAILVEPEGRNTAPAALAAAYWVAKSDSEDSLILLAPSDHAISDPVAFQEAIFAAAPSAEAGNLVTFGIKPTRPETGFGYLELADGQDCSSHEPQKLAAFIEKPDSAQAQEMINSGKYLWNAGIFLFSVKAIIKAFKAHAPDLVEPVFKAVDAAQEDLGFVRLDPDHWSGVEDISIDYAVMEKAENLAVMPYDKGWSDLGSWDAVWRESSPNDKGVVTSEHSTAIDCTNTLLRSEEDSLQLVGIGLDNIVAVATGDAVVIADKDQAQRVKEAVSTLQATKTKQADEFPRDHRPWGWYESLAVGERFQVKRIVVHPGAALSLQSHHHRSEHWIVVAGTAKVTVDEKERLLTENESVYIPLGSVHRLENPGKVLMVLIEVQTGTYLGEDDIIRYEDVYQRS